LIFDVILDPSKINFQSLNDDELIRWVHFDVPAAIVELNHRYGT